VKVRVAILAVALAVTLAWAYGRLHARRERNGWTRPVDVVVYVLGDASPAEVGALGRQLEALAARLAADRASRGGGPVPFRFETVGPLPPERLPPVEAPGPSLLDRAGHALDLWRAERAARALAPEPDPGAFDVRVYLLAAGGASGSAFAEGIGEAGGEVGVVRAGLGGGALLAATAVVHEVLHTLGATDKYDGAGHAVAPDGLWDPGRSPPYPQLRAEIMVGEVPLGPGRGRLPESADEVGIGPRTAAEIGWEAR